MNGLYKILTNKIQSTFFPFQKLNIQSMFFQNIFIGNRLKRILIIHICSQFCLQKDLWEMYIRPLVNVHHFCYNVICSEQKMHNILQFVSWFGVGYWKIQYSSVQRNKSCLIEMNGRSINFHNNWLTSILSYYAHCIVLPNQF